MQTESIVILSAPKISRAALSYHKVDILGSPTMTTLQIMVTQKKIIMISIPMAFMMIPLVSCQV